MAKMESMDRYIVIGLEQELATVRARAQALEAQLAFHRKRAGITHVTAPPRSASSPAEAPRSRRKRTMSADARKRISDAQKARWAKQKAEGTGTGARKKK